MKLKIRLMIIILLLTIIPIVLTTVISYNTIWKSVLSSKLTYIENVIRNQAEDLNSIFENIITSSKQITSSETLVSYIESSNQDNFIINSNDVRLKVINTELSYLYTANVSVNNAMIVNNSGMIIASMDSESIGTYLPDAENYFSLAQKNNGISFTLINDETGSASPMFVVSKIIYSTDNIKQGMLYQVYNVYYIQKFLSSIKLDKNSNTAIMDSNGNLLFYPYKVIEKYESHNNFSPAGSLIENVLNDNSNLSNNTFKEYGTKTNSGYFYNAHIENSNWSVISITNKTSLINECEKFAFSIRNLSILVIIIMIICIIIYVFLFTRPIDEIIDVLQKKKNGDKNIRFAIHTKDEFEYIGEAFNKTFDEVFESEQRYKTIVEMTNNIIFEISFLKDNVYISKNFNKRFSFRPKDDTLLESFFHKLRIHKDDNERYFSDLEKIMDKASNWKGEYRIKNIYGEFGWVSIKGTKFFDRNNIATKIVGVIVDIDKEKKSEMNLLQRASYDALTQLYNRETFLKTLAAEIEISTLKKTLDALMFIDLDDFKFFNDEYGHACGDEVLKFVADTLKEISFERGFSGRFGGDEFVICLTNLTLYGDSGKVAQEIIDVLGKGFTFTFEGRSTKMIVRCSIGIAFLRESGKTTEDVIAAADEAMYNIKKHGKSAYAYAKSPTKKSDSEKEVHMPETSEIDDYNQHINEIIDVFET